MEQIPGYVGVSVNMMMEQADWRFDEKLTAQISSMSQRRRYLAAYLAVCRLQAPLLEIEMPESWGIDREALAVIIHSGPDWPGGEIGGSLDRAVAKIRSAPVLEDGIEPELAEGFQLEAIGAWVALVNSSREMNAGQADAIIIRARELAFYLDACVDDSMTGVAGEEDRERYLRAADEHLRAYGLGYFGTRNIEVERACHDAILAVSADENIPPRVIRVLEEACSEYSAQFLAALRALIAV